MNNEKFLNQEIINKNNERGLVTFFDDDHIVIKYPNCDKIYCPEIAFKNDFLAFCREHDVPLDFFSWHVYSNRPERILEYETEIRETLDSFGYEDTESILNEWNYIQGWLDDDFAYSIRQIKGLKGAAFTAATIESSQYRPLDMLMYYDARPCSFNGLFSTDVVLDRLKGFYPFTMFNTVRKLGTAVELDSDDPTLYGVAASDGSSGAVMLTYFENLDQADVKRVKVNLESLFSKHVKITLFCLDETKDNEVVREEILSGDSASVYLDFNLFTTYLLKIETID